MIKKLLTTFIIACVASTAMAQLQVGDWKMYSVFSGKHVQNIVDTGDIVYYLSDGYLFSYDKRNSESVYYNKRNDLSDMNISNFYYNYNKKYLLIAYANSNIDIIYDNGKIINIPDLKNTVIAGTKAINGIDFQGDEVYVATDFGYLIIDDEKYIIKKSYNYGKKFLSIICTDKYLFADFDSYIWVSGKDDNHFSIDSFSKTNKNYNCRLFKISNDYLGTASGWYNTLHICYNGDPNTLATVQNKSVNVTAVQKTVDGFIVSLGSSYLKIDENGKITAEVSLPAEYYKGSMIASMETDGSIWSLDANGLKHTKINDDATVTVLMDSYRPNVSSVAYPYNIVQDGERLLVMSAGPTYFDSNQRIDFSLSKFEDNQWSNLAPQSFTSINGSSGGTLCSPYSLTVDPEDPDAYWFGSWWDGIICVKNNQVIQQFNNTNSPMILNYICCIPSISFDADGNLWAIFDNETVSNVPILLCLPKEKRFDTTVTKTDWTTYTYSNVTVVCQGTMHITKSGHVLVANNAYKTNLVCLDPNGTPFDKSDDRSIVIGSYIDQDNKSYDISYFYDFAEEENGRIWLATNNGLCYINSADLILQDNFYLNRLKVPRNDGTNLADYLFDGLSVTTVAIDGSNRKWCGTSTAGVYLVSADGTEILEHFTVANSYLPSDVVLTICCDKNSNAVYIGTNKGMVEYRSDAVPSEDNYDNVYAYPNPVRPDYTGDIIIRGLMDNSTVKICDSVGNIVYSTTSNGGMVVWNGCNYNGRRVDTGVYFVMASTNATGSSEGCVTKILVVR